MSSEILMRARWIGFALPLALVACGSGIRIQARSSAPYEHPFRGEVELTSLIPESGWEIASINIRSERGLNDTLQALRDRSAAMGCDLVVVDRFETVWEADENVTVDTYPCGASTCTRVNRDHVIVERFLVHGRGFSRHREGTPPTLDSR